MRLSLFAISSLLTLLNATLAFSTNTKQFDFATAFAKSSNPGQPVPNQYIVVLKSDSYMSASDLKSFKAEYFGNSKTVQLLHKYSISSFYPIVPEMYNTAESNPVKTFQGFSIRTESKSLLDQLELDSRVDYIEQDEYVGVAAPDSTNTVQTNSTWSLNRIWIRNLPYGSNYTYPSTAGANVNVYVVDTGVLASHVELFPRVAQGSNFITGEANTDLQGHGTHVAGIVGSYTYGVAKKVTIVPVKVLNAVGSGTWSGVLAGIQFAVNDAKAKGTRSVINMSIEGSKIVTSINSAISAAVAAGMHFVAAAGNGNTDCCATTPGSSNTGGSIIVGNIDNTDSISSTSNYGACVTIYAPGTSIISLGILSNTALRQMSGTSMASPHVAGVVAVYLSYKWWSPADMKALLVQTATYNTIRNLPSGSNSISNVLYADPTACVNCSVKTSSDAETTIWEKITSIFTPSSSSKSATDDSDSPTVPPNEPDNSVLVKTSREESESNAGESKHHRHHPEFPPRHPRRPPIKAIIRSQRIVEQFEQIIFMDPKDSE